MVGKIIQYEGKSQEEANDLIFEAFRTSEGRSKTLITFFHNILLTNIKPCDYYFSCEMTKEDIDDFRFGLDNRFDIHVPKVV